MDADEANALITSSWVPPTTRWTKECDVLAVE
jgi:hypothetical protein